MLHFILSLLMLSCAVQLEAEEKTSTRSYDAGELGAAWEFPSDHLPVGGTVGNVHFALWNVLNTDYLHWIEMNGQGLRESLILSANVPGEYSSLTLREEMLITNILEMLQHPSCPRSIVALQELGAPVFNALVSCLPGHYKLFPNEVDSRDIQDVFIVDEKVFEVMDYAVAKYTFKENTIVKLVAIEKATGLKYCFIQSHVPGGPIDSKAARMEFSNFVMDYYDPDVITILLGDMNRSPDYFIPHFDEAARQRDISHHFKILEIPYATHVDTHREFTWIDNVFVSNPHIDLPVIVSSRSEYFEQLGKLKMQYE